MTNRIRANSCEDGRLRQLLAGEMSGLDAQQMERHLEQCASCRERLESLAADEQWWSGLPRFLSPQSRLDVLDGEAAFDSYEQLINKYLLPAEVEGTLGRFGEFDIEEVVGAGAMGVVLKARDGSLDRRVAIKVLSPHYADSESARRRFERESRSVAAVVHPHVVPIHAVDAAHELPYLVMAYVSGESLHERLRRNGPLDSKDVLRIGMQTAQGLAAAHSQGIVHRDVKPANILLEDGLERVVLSDFGLARAIDDATMTRSGMLAGTPEYMSPEQAKGELVDHRSDLFSLGCVMYAMCTGQSPFRAESTMAVLKRICEAEPAGIRNINDAVPDWLQDVIEKLLEKNPDDRYQSASIVARLLEQCLGHAQQPSAIPLPREISHDLARERKRKRYAVHSRRHWLWATLGVAIVIGSAVLTKSFLDNRSKTISPPVTKLDGHTAPVYTLAFSPNGDVLGTAGNESSIILWDVNAGKEAVRLDGLSKATRSLAFNMDGTLLASAGANSIGHDDTISLWDTSTGTERFTLRGHVGSVSGVSFSPDGVTLASCGDDRTIKLWDVVAGKERATLEGHNGAVWIVSFSPDGGTLASGSDDMRTFLWDVATGERIGGLKGNRGAVRSLVFNSTGSMLATGSFDAAIRLWDVAEAKKTSGLRPVLTLKGHSEPVVSLSFSPDDKVLASASWDSTIKLWDVVSGTEIATIDAHEGFVWSVAFHPDGIKIASAGEDATIRIWQLSEDGGIDLFSSGTKRIGSQKVDEYAMKKRHAQVSFR